TDLGLGVGRDSGSAVLGAGVVQVDVVAFDGAAVETSLEIAWSADAGPDPPAALRRSRCGSRFVFRTGGGSTVASFEVRDGARAEARQRALDAALGPTPAVVPPPPVEGALAALLSPTRRLVVGDLCGYGGEPPPGASETQ